MNIKNILILLALLIIAFAIWQFGLPSVPDENETSSVPSKAVVTAEASYTCDEGKTITAAYLAGSSVPAGATDEMPSPTGSVNLVLGDGRTMILPQTISASGIRYANADESFVFWSKGETAFTEENGVAAYENCVEVTSPSTGY